MHSITQIVLVSNSALTQQPDAGKFLDQLPEPPGAVMAGVLEDHPGPARVLVDRQPRERAAARHQVVHQMILMEEVRAPAVRVPRQREPAEDPLATARMQALQVAVQPEVGLAGA